MFLDNKKIIDNNYRFGDAEHIASKNKYKDFILKLLHILYIKFNIDAYLQFNITYWAEREWSRACSEANIPFYTEHKESLHLPSVWKLLSTSAKKWYGNYYGSHLLVYNNIMRENLLKLGVVNSDRIEVFGSPRLDYFHKIRTSIKQNIKAKTVIYYLIGNNAGLPRTLDKKKLSSEFNLGSDNFTWRILISKLNQLILRFAKNNPNIKIILKAKTGFEKEQLSDFKNNLPNNIKIISGGVAQDLVLQASVVIGFNSTTLLEAIASGIPVLVPNFLNNDEIKLKEFILDLEGAVYYVNNENDFDTILKDLLIKKSKKILSKRQKKVLNYYMGNSDGLSSLQIYKFIEKTISKKLTFTNIKTLKD